MAQLRNQSFSAQASVGWKVLSFTVASIAASTTKRVAKFRLPFACELLAVDTDTSAIAGTAALVDVQIGGTSALAAPFAVASNAGTTGALSATQTARRAAAATAILVTCTTVAGATVTDLTVTITYRPVGLRGGLA